MIGWDVYTWKENCRGHITGVDFWYYNSTDTVYTEELAAVLNVAARKMLNKCKKKQCLIIITVDNEQADAIASTTCSKKAWELLKEKTVKAKRYISVRVMTHGGGAVKVTAKKRRN